MPQQRCYLACPKKLHLFHFIGLHVVGDTQQGVPGQFIRFDSELKGKATRSFITFPLELDEGVFHRLDKLSNHDGQQTTALYDLFMHQVEAPLFECVMQHTQDNQSKAAALLGLNRGTLRKKLKQYDLL